jgi:hypothetical protein
VLHDLGHSLQVGQVARNEGICDVQELQILQLAKHGRHRRIVEVSIKDDIVEIIKSSKILVGQLSLINMYRQSSSYKNVNPMT